jgi:hypothetical protein
VKDIEGWGEQMARAFAEGMRVEKPGKIIYIDGRAKKFHVVRPRSVTAAGPMPRLERPSRWRAVLARLGRLWR